MASPATSPFPNDPIGQHAAWVWAALQTGGTPISTSEIEAHSDPSLLAQASADKLAMGFVQVQQLYGPFTLDSGSIVATKDNPSTQLQFIITGKDDTRLAVYLTMSPDSKLLTGVAIRPAPATTTPVASPLPSGLTDTDISFTSGPDTLYGSFMAPEGLSTSSLHPAALIISGSGPTDRNGDSGSLPLGTNRNLAITLAQAGVPSLRYDKLGSGKTGLGSRTTTTGIDYTLFLQEAHDAAAALAAQQSVDPKQLILVGHSEGALFALDLAQAMVKAGTPPAGLILAAPLAIRYLDVLQEQIDEQIATATKAGTITAQQGETVDTELKAIIASLRTDGTLPETIASPELAQIFTPDSATFLAQADKIDPADLAASLPKTLPVLVLRGEKDSQVTEAQVQHLMDGFAKAGNTRATFVSLPNANHVLKIVEGVANPSVDYANPDLPFSPEAVTAIDSFLKESGLGT